MGTTPFNQSRTAAQFITAVSEFETLHGRTIDDFLTKESTPENNALVAEFFTHPIIHHYLSRKADTIRFLKNRPCNSCLTEVELKIYRLRPDLFPFRKNADNSNFYSEGAYTSQYFFNPLKARYQQLEGVITSSMDVYEIRKYLNEYTYNKAKSPSPIKFILTPNWKDTHASTMLHIINPETKRVLTSVFINTLNSKEYSDYISNRFNMKNSQNFYYYDPQKGIQHLSVPDITERLIPFIDASHHLQLADGDKNCTLYGLNFLEAIAQMLSVPEMSQKIFNLAQLVDQNDKNKTMALHDLQAIFTDGLKDYLPCYYSDRKNKTFSDIKESHLAQRWNLGSDILSLTYPEQPSTMELSTEPLRSKIFKPYIGEQGKISSLYYTGQNNIVRFVFDHVISILEQEKRRLVLKYTPLLKDHSTHPETNLQRIIILETLIDQIAEELISFEDENKTNVTELKQNLEIILSTQLASKTLDKYQDWETKLALKILNVLSFLLAPVKKLFTGSWFFSLEGKSQEANTMALQEISNMPSSR